MSFKDLSDDALEQQIAGLSSLIQAATHRLLCLVAEYDRRGSWSDPLDSSGFRSCAHWLAWRTGMSTPTARQYVRVAKALPELPRVSEAFSCGEISYSKVRALTRVANPSNEETVLGWARAVSASQLERVLRDFRRVTVAQEREQAVDQNIGRSLITYFDSDGMLVVKGRLAPEQGVLLMKALEVATDELRAAEDGSAEPLLPEDPVRETSADQLRADALARVAERGLEDCSAHSAADRFQVVVHVDAEVLADPEADGRCKFEHGPRLAAETARRLACDCTRSEMVHGPKGELRPGRKSRAVSAPLRRALKARDGTRCAFPGCTCRARDAHHLQHWVDGGPTVLENLLGLCRAHHTLVHEDGFTVQALPGGGVRFRKPDGQVLSAAPAMPVVNPGSAEPRLLEGLPTGVKLEEVSGRPPWELGKNDYEWAVEYLMQTAREARLD